MVYFVNGFLAVNTKENFLIPLYTLWWVGMQLLNCGSANEHDFFYAHLYAGLYHEAQVRFLI